MKPDRDPRSGRQAGVERGSEERNVDADGESYRYQHSGIRERRGGIPLWLVIVVIALIGWSVYYTIRYWSSE